jgi:hypothetical protein
MIAALSDPIGNLSLMKTGDCDNKIEPFCNSKTKFKACLKKKDAKKNIEKNGFRQMVFVMCNNQSAMDSVNPTSW